MGLHRPETISSGRFHWLPVFKADLERLARWTRGEVHPLKIDIAGWGGAERLLDAREVTLDIETSMDGKRIHLVGLAGESGPAHVLPWGSEARDLLQELVRREVLLIGHNLTFDLTCLSQAGVEFPEGQKVYDTLHATSLLLPDYYKGLGRVASVYLDLYPWKHLARVDRVRYNATDVLVTRALKGRLEGLIAEAGMTGLMQTVNARLLPWARMSQRGMRVDLAQLDVWKRDTARRLEEARIEWEKYAAVPLGSVAKVGRYFYGKARSAGWLEDEALGRLALRRPEKLAAAMAYSRWRRVKREADVRIEPDADGLIHPVWMPYDPERGGKTTLEPDLALLGPVGRRMIVPRQKDHRIWVLDYGDTFTELLFSKENTMVGVDAVRSKATLEGFLRRWSAGSLAARLTIKGFTTTVKQAEGLYERFREASPRLTAWVKAVEREGVEKGFLTNSYGRVRYFYGNRMEEGEPVGATVHEMVEWMVESNMEDRMRVNSEGWTIGRYAVGEGEDSPVDYMGWHPHENWQAAIDASEPLPKLGEPR